VYGALWRLHEVEVAALDMYYGVPQRFDRYGSIATLMDGRRCSSEFYAAHDRNAGAARPAYLEQIMATGRRLGFPDEYLRELASWITPQDVSIRAG